MIIQAPKFPVIIELKRTDYNAIVQYGNCKNFEKPESVGYLVYCLDERLVIEKCIQWTTSTPLENGGCKVQNHILILQMFTYISKCKRKGIINWTFEETDEEWNRQMAELL